MKDRQSYLDIIGHQSSQLVCGVPRFRGLVLLMVFEHCLLYPFALTQTIFRWVFVYIHRQQSFSWAKWHAHCKLHVWTILRMRIALVSKPLNWSAITTKYHRNNSTFFKIRYIYTKGRNLTFKIVYSIGLDGSQKNRQNRSSASGDLPVRSAPMICYWHIPHYSKMALVNINEALKEEYFMEQDLFGWIWPFTHATNSMCR